MVLGQERYIALVYYITKSKSKRTCPFLPVSPLVGLVGAILLEDLDWFR